MSEKPVDFCLSPIAEQKFVTLTLTNSCNLNCGYCYEHSKTSQGMSFDIAKKILTHELNEKNQFKHVNIEFFGGEPFIEFELIKGLISFLRKGTFSKSYTVSITTNGTLVHGDIQKWLIENKDIVSCGLSWDGTPDMQDVNRSNSSRQVDLSFFQKLYPNRPLKMTVSPETLKDLADGVIYCHELGFQVFCNLAYGPDWIKQEYDTILQRELMKLIDYYLVNPEIPPCSMLSDKMSQIVFGQEAETIHSWCAAGTQTCAYDVFGNKYPCQFFMPLSSGAQENYGKNIKFLADVPIGLLDEKCRSCVIKTACPTCYGFNYSKTGSIYKRDDGLCKLTKTILKARSYFLSILWEAGKLKLDKNEEQALLRSILIVQENL